MGLPDVTFSIQDGALGVASPNTNNQALKMGVFPVGLLNTLYSVSDLPTLRKTVGNLGKAVDAAAWSLNDAGGPLLLCPVNPSVAGTIGTPAKIGAGTETLTAAAGPTIAIIVKVTTGGALGVAQVAFSFDGGVTYGSSVATSATLQVPGMSLVTLAFAAGTMVVGDTYTIPVNNGAIVHTGTGPTNVTLSAAQVVDDYQVLITYVAGGALGTATFTYSLDNGLTTSAVQLVPSSGIFVIPDTGIVLTFGGTATAGDQWTIACTAPGYAGSDLTTAFNAIIANPTTWFLMHVVGAPTTSANGATLLATIDGLMTTAANSFRFAAAIMENPQDTDANIITAYASASSLRTMVSGGFLVRSSPLNGIQLKRPVAWADAARLAKIPPSEDAGRLASGSLPGVVSLVRDEQATPGLDAARFVTARTIIGKQGYYLTTSREMAPNGSDYTYTVNRRVMDIFCSAFRSAALQFLNDSVRVDPTTGYILEQDAQAIENYIDGQVRAAVTQPGYASNITIAVTRNNNILSTGQLQITGRCVPLGYNRAISVNIGFTNPALAQKSF